MKWLDELANKLADIFSCPTPFREPQQTPAVTPPAGVTFSEEEISELQEEVDELYADYDTLLKLAGELRVRGKFKKADKDVLDEFDAFIRFESTRPSIKYRSECEDTTCEKTKCGCKAKR